VQLGISKVEAAYNGEPTYIKNIDGINYAIQEFKSSGTFIVPANISSIDVTVVGGGGGGGGTEYRNAGGGGGGGYVVSQYGIPVTPGQSINVTIGAGGIGGDDIPGTNGQSSQFASIVASGGSGGNSSGLYGGYGGDGGSGGGGGGPESGGGGDGGSNGSDGTSGNHSMHTNEPGEGGYGQGTITYGVNGVLYAGGGGGGAGCSRDTFGDGGSGGGGRGGYDDGYSTGYGISAQSGTPNTGGGGGGAGGAYTPYYIVAAGNGGSGIVVVRWVANFNPTITVTSPAANSAYSELSGYSTIALAGTVSDPNTGDIITIKYNIDTGATQTLSGTVTTSGSFTANINVGTLTEGSHNLNVWCVDNKNAVSSTVTRPFKMDRTAPVLGTVTFTSATNSVTISGAATDAIAGLPTDKYQYTLLTKPVVPWSSQVSQSFTGLTPNTQYTAKFEARDSVGHISAKQQNIYTKAAVPTAAVSNPKSYTLDVSMSDTNPSATLYQIVANTNKYVTPEGALTTSPVWITPSGKKITVKGLSPSTTYTFQVKAKNGDGVETALSSPVSGTTLIAPPAAPAGIIATATSNTVTLSWSTAATAESYEVEADGTIKSAGTSTTYTHTGLNPGTPHTYRIRGINAGGSGSWSTIVEKSTRPSAPDIPSNLTAIPLSTSVTVTWNNVPGATGYDILVDDVLVNNGPNTNYRHTSLTPGTSHTYKVRSVNAGDKSG
jgi:hypothetical protein